MSMIVYDFNVQGITEKSFKQFVKLAKKLKLKYNSLRYGV
jgi:hypothetical protein